MAHVVRPFALARCLDPDLFDITFCRPPAFQWLTIGADFTVLDLRVQESSVFARRLARGWPVYDYLALKQYVEDDLALIDSVQPDAIVGDFRLSLSVSARLRSIPYLAVCDAYWSPERALKAVLPVLGITPYVPLSVADKLFQRVSGLAFRVHAVPLERLRAKYGLPSLGFDIRKCYSDADLRLFANFPLLFPDVQTSDQAVFIGPITWFPETAPSPDFSGESDLLIYLTMGSSGDFRLLEKIVPVLEETGAPVVVATAGKTLFKSQSRKTRVFDFLPGNVVCKKAKLVVCNGGSPTTSQALASGVPVLGIAQNMDQFLNMQTIEAFGAGKVMRADRMDLVAFRSVVSDLLQDSVFGDRASDLAASCTSDVASATLTSHIMSLCGKTA